MGMVLNMALLRADIQEKGRTVDCLPAKVLYHGAGMDVDQSGETSWMEFVEFISAHASVGVLSKSVQLVGSMNVSGKFQVK